MRKIHPAQVKLLNLALSSGLNGLTFQELADFAGLKSRQSVWHHLLQLDARGLIDLNSRTATKKVINSSLANIPVLGLADCGNPRQIAEEKIQGYIRVSAGFAPSKGKQLFAVRAVGNSMNRASVNQRYTVEDGDYLLIDPAQTNPRTGDYVLSIIDGAANIKKFYRDGDRIILLSESTENLPPIIIHPDDSGAYLVNGKVIDVIKKPARPRN